MRGPGRRAGRRGGSVAVPTREGALDWIPRRAGQMTGTTRHLNMTVIEMENSGEMRSVELRGDREAHL